MLVNFLLQYWENHDLFDAANYVEKNIQNFRKISKIFNMTHVYNPPG